MKKVVMTETEVIELMDGYRFILAVDFTKIGHLGVYEQREINCILYEGTTRFNPKVHCEFVLTEQQISNILKKFIHEVGTLWTCDDTELFSTTKTRYFSKHEPQRPFWENPMSKDV